jgi:bacteriocin biosynthesis cyclodehydratase domain-containing protein
VGRVVAGGYAADAGEPAPHLAVVVGSGALDAERARPWMVRRVPHLPVVLHGTSAEVGPLVRPGRGPCLRCLDLARADLDPGWPAVLAQLAPPSVGPPADASGETSLVFATAGLAAMVALAALDGHEQPVGVSVDVSLPLPHLGERLWAAHPGCRCGASDTVGVPATAARGVQATMAG